MESNTKKLNKGDLKMKIDDFDVLDLIEKKIEILVRKSEDVELSIQKGEKEIKNLTNAIKLHEQMKDELKARADELMVLMEEIENEF